MTQTLGHCPSASSWRLHFLFFIFLKWSNIKVRQNIREHESSLCTIDNSVLCFLMSSLLSSGDGGIIYSVICTWALLSVVSIILFINMTLIIMAGNKHHIYWIKSYISSSWSCTQIQKWKKKLIFCSFRLFMVQRGGFKLFHVPRCRCSRWINKINKSQTVHFKCVNIPVYVQLVGIASCFRSRSCINVLHFACV